MILSDPEAKLSTASFAFLQRWARQTCGVVLESEHRLRLQTRLAAVLAQHHIASVDSLCRALAAGPSAVHRATVEAVTVHETSFFRDPAAFAALRDDLLPRLLATRPPESPLRIWSAAASSGQEAFSVAMLLLEANVAPERISVLGTDICETTLDRARHAIFGWFEVRRGVPSHLLSKYFLPCLDSNQLPAFRVCDQVRSLVRFAPVDVRSLPPHLGLFDLILCRNVMIYFDQPTRLSIFAGLHQVLAHDGFLMLGTAESGTHYFLPVPSASTVAYVPA